MGIAFGLATYYILRWMRVCGASHDQQVSSGFSVLMGVWRTAVGESGFRFKVSGCRLHWFQINSGSTLHPLWLKI